MKNELKIELVSELCKECPRIELETRSIGSHVYHRCKNIQLCRQVIGFWLEKNKLHELEVTYMKEGEVK